MPATAPITIDVLRYLLTNGLSTKAEIAKGLGTLLPPSTLSNLHYLAHISSDNSTLTTRYAITPKGIAKLQGVKLASQHAVPNRAEAARRARSYQAVELGSQHTRPGSMDAYALPSRVGSRLHWPDGRVTSIDHPTTTTTNGAHSHG